MPGTGNTFAVFFLYIQLEFNKIYTSSNDCENVHKAVETVTKSATVERQSICFKYNLAEIKPCFSLHESHKRNFHAPAVAVIVKGNFKVLAA